MASAPPVSTPPTSTPPAATTHLQDSLSAAHTLFNPLVYAEPDQIASTDNQLRQLLEQYRQIATSVQQLDHQISQAHAAPAASPSSSPVTTPVTTIVPVVPALRPPSLPLPILPQPVVTTTTTYTPSYGGQIRTTPYYPGLPALLATPPPPNSILPPSNSKSEFTLVVDGVTKPFSFPLPPPTLPNPHHQHLATSNQPNTLFSTTTSLNKGGGGGEPPSSFNKGESLLDTKQQFERMAAFADNSGGATAQTLPWWNNAVAAAGPTELGDPSWHSKPGVSFGLGLKLPPPPQLATHIPPPHLSSSSSSLQSPPPPPVTATATPAVASSPPQLTKGGLYADRRHPQAAAAAAAPEALSLPPPPLPPPDNRRHHHHRDEEEEDHRNHRDEHRRHHHEDRDRAGRHGSGCLCSKCLTPEQFAAVMDLHQRASAAQSGGGGLSKGPPRSSSSSGISQQTKTLEELHMANMHEINLYKRHLQRLKGQHGAIAAEAKYQEALSKGLESGKELMREAKAEAQEARSILHADDYASNIENGLIFAMQLADAASPLLGVESDTQYIEDLEKDVLEKRVYHPALTQFVRDKWQPALPNANPIESLVTGVAGGYLRRKMTQYAPRILASVRAAAQTTPTPAEKTGVAAVAKKKPSTASTTKKTGTAPTPTTTTTTMEKANGTTMKKANGTTMNKAYGTIMNKAYGGGAEAVAKGGSATTTTKKPSGSGGVVVKGGPAPTTSKTPSTENKKPEPAASSVVASRARIVRPSSESPSPAPLPKQKTETAAPKQPEPAPQAQSSQKKPEELQTVVTTGHQPSPRRKPEELQTSPRRKPEELQTSPRRKPEERQTSIAKSEEKEEEDVAVKEFLRKRRPMAAPPQELSVGTYMDTVKPLFKSFSAMKQREFAMEQRSLQTEQCLNELMQEELQKKTQQALEEDKEYEMWAARQQEPEIKSTPPPAPAAVTSLPPQPVSAAVTSLPQQLPVLNTVGGGSSSWFTPAAATAPSLPTTAASTSFSNWTATVAVPSATIPVSPPASPRLLSIQQQEQRRAQIEALNGPSHSNPFLLV